jgi:hypothetical protein
MIVAVILVNGGIKRARKSNPPRDETHFDRSSAMLFEAQRKGFQWANHDSGL